MKLFGVVCILVGLCAAAYTVKLIRDVIAEHRAKAAVKSPDLRSYLGPSRNVEASRWAKDDGGEDA
jgi:hypothetical protein